MLTVTKAAACALLMTVATGANAHELFVSFLNKPTGDSLDRTAVVSNGTFHESVGAVPRDRLRDVSVHQAGIKTQPELGTWGAVGKQSQLVIHPNASGTVLLGISTKMSTSTRTATDFAKYLELEDLPDTLASYDASRYPKGVTYGYTKHARAIGQIGDVLTDDYAASLGYPLEIQLSRNPGGVKAGERLTLHVLYNGRPEPGLRVYVGAGAHAPNQGAHGGATLLRTDAEGKAEFEVSTGGTWYIHANRMAPSEQGGLDFMSDRASLTFDVLTDHAPQ